MRYDMYAATYYIQYVVRIFTKTRTMGADEGEQWEHTYEKN